MARCLVGCGSNLGGRREHLDRAIELLRFMPGVSLRAVSRYRETRPVGGPPGQGAYLNGACLVETDLAPGELLDALGAVEQTLHRDRTERWAARTIDLDLLLYEDLVVERDDLTLPHPRMATRRFVLEPCVEIAPDLPHPVSGCSLRDLLDNISVPHPLVAVVGAPGGLAADVAAAVADATLARHLPAPAPLPATAAVAAWRETAAAWARPLAAGDWDDAGPGTIADFWLDSLPLLAAAHVDAPALETLEADVAALAAATVVPNVVILAVADAESLAMRISSRLCRPGRRPDRTPRAVVTVDARDPARAVAEATAAVEAML